ncbi:cAMP-regulated D2 protein [Anguilla rostrata]|uniref:cAMP-regulated D2 protein n=1 Tax=Anguilla rostrata TaxID=7938 RepID=UPI0030D5735F
MENSFSTLPFFTLGFVLDCAGATFSEKEISVGELLRSISSGLRTRDEPAVIERALRFEGKALELPESKNSIYRKDSEDSSPGVPGTGPTPDAPKVQTKDGILTGLAADKAYIFYGIPYASPPVGAARWTPPTPVAPWAGAYDASFPRASCMQACIGPVSEACPGKVSEDCLYLNIFVPLSVDFASPLLKPLPVMVWIHGGDFIVGSASKPLYDGRFMSNFTHTVLVSVDYRLGAFGFLVSGNDPETSAVGNYGILDQQAALLWVHQNIALFGGDPNKVTIFGESAGAQSVSLHLMMQSSAPLFKQAVFQSLPFSVPLKTRCSKIVNPFRFLEVFETWGPYIDGELIKEQVVTAFQKGQWQREKPLLLGTTSEEGVAFVYGVLTEPVSVLECVVYTTAIFKQHSPRILHKYLPLYKDTDRRTMLAQIVTDYIFQCPARRAARTGVDSGSNVWVYVFDHAVADRRAWRGLPFCVGRVCHGAELPFLFGTALLASRMLCLWGAFAHGGDPAAGPDATRFCRCQRPPVWPRYSRASGWPVMNLTVPAHPQAGARDHLCDFWDKLGIY